MSTTTGSSSAGADVRALVPASGFDADTPPEALIAFYAELPSEVAATCEAQRRALVRDVLALRETHETVTRDTLARLRIIHDATAPFGGFKEWCEAAGFPYGAILKALNRADNKQPADMSAGSLSDKQPKDTRERYGLFVKTGYGIYQNPDGLWSPLREGAREPAALAATFCEVIAAKYTPASLTDVGRALTTIGEALLLAASALGASQGAGGGRDAREIAAPHVVDAEPPVSSVEVPV